MKKLFLVCLVAVCALQVSAQSALFPTKKGTVELHVQKDAKGTILSYTRMTITNVEGTVGNMTITYGVEALDKDKKPLSTTEATPFKVVIKDNVMIFDLKSMFGAQAGAKVEVTGDPIELPNKLTVGQTLKDANITMTTKAGLMKTKTEIKMSNGKCEAIENVTVPAGTFKCYKVSQTATMTVMKQTIATKSITWYAEKAGAVKVESYDDKGALLSKSELAELK